MDIWESYEGLPPLERIVINFTVTALFIIAVFRIDKWAKNRKWVTPGVSSVNADPKPFLYSNLKRKADGILVAYIAFWRYLFFGLFYAVAFYICINGFVYFYRELPPAFWKHWDKAATVALVILTIAIAMPFMAYNLLKGGYKKVQLEINKDSVRYLKSAIRGGILLSDNYNSVLLKDIIDVEFRRNPLGGGVIDARTASQTHSMILLLSTEEQLVCYRALDDAIKNLQVNRRKT